MTTIQLTPVAPLSEGLTFYGTKSLSTASGMLQFRTIPGWYGGGDAKGPVRERAQAPGAWGRTRDYRSSLAIAIEGWYQCSSHGQLIERLAEVEGALALGTMYTMRVDDGVVPTERQVEVRAVRQTENVRTRWVEYSIDLLATDPVRYADEIVDSTGLRTDAAPGGLVYPLVYPLDYGPGPGDSGRAVIENPGRKLSYPMLEITGGLPGGFQLTDLSTGKKLRYERTVVLGTTVHLDSRAQRAWLNIPENDVRPFLTLEQWWAVGPSESRTIQFEQIGGYGAPTGTPTLTTRLRPGY